jgi:hypothetical protein
VHHEVSKFLISHDISINISKKTTPGQLKGYFYKYRINPKFKEQFFFVELNEKFRYKLRSV